jgi:HSP20 family protein
MDVKSLVPWRRYPEVLTPRVPEEASPFRALPRLMGRLFDDFLGDFNVLRLRDGWSGDRPNLDVSETDKEVEVTAELPGLDEKDIDVIWRDGLLTLKGEKKIEHDGSVYRERWHGQFERSLQLGPDVDPDTVKADFKKGVLTITFEKRPEAQRQVRRIAINCAD